MLIDCTNKLDEINNFLYENVDKAIYKKFSNELTNWLNAQYEFVISINKNTEKPDLETARIAYESSISLIQLEDKKKLSNFIKMLSDLEKLTLAHLISKGLK